MSAIAVRTIMGEEDSLQWVLSDHINSASVTANEDGTWNSTILYNAFGEVRERSGVTGTKYRYTGQLAQDVLGLDYYVARWMDPLTGHFITADAIIPNPGKSTGFDRYSYGGNNPVRFNDPTGHVVNPPTCGGWWNPCRGDFLWNYPNDNFESVYEIGSALFCYVGNCSVDITNNKVVSNGPNMSLPMVVDGLIPPEIITDVLDTDTSSNENVIGKTSNVIPDPTAIDPISDLYNDPWQLLDKTPEDIPGVINWAEENGWKAETLRKGTSKGKGLILREYGENGKATGRMIEWNPESTHHGPDPYWKISSPKTGTERIGPQFIKPRSRLGGI